MSNGAADVVRGDVESNEMDAAGVGVGRDAASTALGPPGADDADVAAEPAIVAADEDGEVRQERTEEQDYEKGADVAGDGRWLGASRYCHDAADSRPSDFHVHGSDMGDRRLQEVAADQATYWKGAQPDQSWLDQHHVTTCQSQHRPHLSGTSHLLTR